MTPEAAALSKNAASNGNKRQSIIARDGSTIREVKQIIAEKYFARSETEELSDRLGRAVENYESRMERAFFRRTVSERPYKGLAPFELEDFPIFFGHDDVIDELHQKTLNNRLTVLRARSGAGKTSLLKAGLSPRLIKEGLLLPVYVHAYEELTSAIKEVIAPASFGPWPELLQEIKQIDFLSLACACLRQFKGLAVILDQFEGFFSQLDHHVTFIEALADCYEDEALPVHFLIALRTDYYDHLEVFRERLPGVFDNVFPLVDLSQVEVQKAIAEPVTKLERPVNYEPALLEKLLNDLGRGGMELSHLQIICTQLYKALPGGEALITVAPYKESGRAEGIMSEYLNSVLQEKLAGKEEEIARDVLKELVISEATRRTLSCDELVARVNVQESELEHVLRQLVDNRLLRRDVAQDRVYCEMPYGYLIKEIMRWIDLEDLEYQQAKELLEREVASWRGQSQRTLIPKDRLEVLHAQRLRFRGLDEETLRCLADSALHTGFAVEDWAKLVGEAGEERFVSALGHDDWSIRERAARALGEIGSPCAVESLIATLKDKENAVRRAVVGALGKVNDPRALNPLTKALKDEDPLVRRAAAEALEEMGEPAVESLIIALQDEDFYNRMIVVEALRKVGDPRAVDPLITALKGDKDGNVRKAAAEALVVMSNARAVDPLIAALKDDKDSYVRKAAAEALVVVSNARAVDPLITALKDDKDSYVREAAAEALVVMSNAGAVDPLIAALQDEDWRGRRLAARILGEIRHPRAVQALTQALEDGNVREAAAWALGEIGNPRAVQPLVAALLDEDGHLRQPIAEALGRISDPQAVEPLIQVSSNQEEAVREWVADVVGTTGSGAVMPLAAALEEDVWQVRQTAAWALGMTDAPQAVPPLVGALADKKRPDLQSAAAWALGQLGNPAAAEPLIKALKDNETDHDVRRLAAWALGEIGDSDAVKPYVSDAVKQLIAALDDGEWSVRKEAAEALGKIGDSDAVKRLINVLENDDYYDVCEAAAKALGEIGKSDAVKSLIRVLEGDQDGQMREAAAEALGEIGDSDAIKPLINVLEKDGDYFVLEAAAEALGAIGDPHAVDPLIKILEDNEMEGRGPVHRAAAKALGSIGHPQAINPLIKRLRDVWAGPRAAWALGKIGDPQAVNSLIAASQDDWLDVARVAIWALGKIGGPSAMERLTAALGDGFLRKVAAQALSRIGDREAVDPLIDALRSEARRVRRKKAQVMLDVFRVEESLSEDDSGGEDDDALDALAEALGQLGEPAVAPLIETYNEKDPNMRWAAVKALGEIGDARAVELLIAAMRDEDSYVREEATWALGENRENKALEKLKDALKDEIWQVRKAAAWALGEIGDSSTVKPLKTALEDEVWRVGEAAAEALEIIGTPEALKALEEWQRGWHE